MTGRGSSPGRTPPGAPLTQVETKPHMYLRGFFFGEFAREIHPGLIYCGSRFALPFVKQRGEALHAVVHKLRCQTLLISLFQLSPPMYRILSLTDML